MNDAGVAKRYAQALFMLADESQNVDKIGNDLRLACDTITGNAELAQTYTGAQFSLAGKRGAITKIFQNQVDPRVLNFLLLLIEKHRTTYLADITEAYFKLDDEKKGIIDATATSAYPLKEDDAKNIALTLGKRLGKTVRLKVVVDPSIVAGVKLQYGDKIIDGSVHSRLESMRKRLMTQENVGGEDPQ